ncbi:endonuclease/exonuclease/phosphatase family protein [Marivita sp. GX14005]|uniref:endonuclease/exonuclease/phosphatase family protein n=1 Tax=Marivita sp. GX14005 TaxID=2942276 RepID=UPI002019ECAC|nr:endonuclease/exonuclease/phosphatase family protein [Marivita sp. GX14005]MCL3883232.1 endonuclease/exonuclease/phosphatase family protein [Marivita sp. GX14005]
MIELSCISWNIHRGRGEDGRIDPARTADVLIREVLRPGTDLLILQEADEEQPPHRGLLDLGRIEAQTGLRHLHGADGRWGGESHGFLGTVMLAAPGLEMERMALVDMPGHCHRGAVVADLRKAGAPVRVIGTHLSLAQWLRAAQTRTLGQYLFRCAARPLVLCGDLNEWRPWGGLAFSRAVTGQAFSGPARATFPVRWPVLPLDRVLGAGGARVRETRVLDGTGIRIASDHRPLAAVVELPG